MDRDGSIGEISESEEEDRKVYTSEEAAIVVNKPVQMAGFAEAFYGKENIDQLRKLLADPILRDLDNMLLTGDISWQEALEYFMVLDDVQDLLVRLREHAQKMTASTRGKISYHLRDVIRDGKVKTGAIAKLLNGTSDLMYLDPRLLGDAPSSLAVTALYFCNALSGQYLIAIRKEISQKFPDRECAITHKFLALDGGEMDPHRYAFSGLHAVDHNLADPDSKAFHDLFKGEFPDEGVLDAMFREIQILSRFRTISFTTPPSGEEQLELKLFHINDNDRGRDIERISSICAVAVSMLHKGERMNILGFTIDRYNGNLDYGGVDMEDVLGQEKERVLRHRVFLLLLEHLRQKPEDVAHAVPTSPRKKGEIPPPTEADEIPDVSPEESPAEILEETAVAVETTIPTAVTPGPRPTPEIQGYDRYRVSIARLQGAMNDAIRNHGGRLRMVRVLNDKIAARFMESWEALFERLGFHGEVRWYTMTQIGENSNGASPLVIPHSLNTHISEGWKRRQRNVYVIPVTSPNLIANYLENVEDRAALDENR